MNSVATEGFWKLYRTLPKHVRQAAQDAYRAFRADPSIPGLAFKRLQSDPNVWSVRVTRDYRAVGRRHGDTMIWFWIGSHADFDKKM